MNFFSRYKRLLIIILFIAFVGGTAYLLYFFFFRSATVPTTIDISETATATTNRLPLAEPGSNINPAGNENENLPSGSDNPTTSPSLIINQNPNIDKLAVGGITNTSRLVTGPTSGQTINSQNGKIQYYNPADGKFYAVDQNGQTSLLTNKVFYNVDQITWDKKGAKAVLEYPDGSKIVYDFINKTQATLPKHWEDFNFSSSGDQLVIKSLGMDQDNRYLAIANSDGSGGKIIEYIGTNDKSVYPSWSPNNQIVAMYTEGLDYDRQTVYFLGLSNENFKSTVIPGRGFQQQWSPDGNRLLYSVYYSENQMKPMLWVVDAAGGQIGDNRQMLNVQTWASKCTFSGDTELYCAVPTSLEYGAGFLPSLSNQTPDQIYKINTKTGTKQLIAIPENDVTINSLFVSPDGTTLYFTNTNNGSINKIQLR
jgi:hypothetical protein